MAQDNSLPQLASQHIGIFACPRCGGPLNLVESRSMECGVCHHSFGSDQGIALLFCANEWNRSEPDLTQTIQSFYEENPFPDYEETDSLWSLMEKARTGLFARLLDEQIPHGNEAAERSQANTLRPPTRTQKVA